MNEKLTDYFNIGNSTKSNNSTITKLHRKIDDIQKISDDALIEKQYTEKISSTNTDKEIYGLTRPKKITINAKLEQ